MVIIESYSVAIIFLVVTMLCWGSWANTQKLASKKWPFPLFYWDYTIGLLLMTIVFGFTLGSIGTEGRSFVEDLKQASAGNMLSAFIGGVVFNIANLLVVAAIDIAGMAVAFPIGIGLALVLGVLINYISRSEGNPVVLFTGVALVTIAIIINAIAYKKHSSTQKDSAPPIKGIILAILGGVLMSTFYYFVARTLPGCPDGIPDCGFGFANPNPGSLEPYGALFIFALGIFISNFLWNSIFMYVPIQGGKPATYRDYFTKGTPRLHLIGVLGGIIWCIGTSFSYITAEAASPAIAYGLGQGATMVAAIWGVFIWKEFKGASKRTNLYLFFMFLSFIVGLGLIIYARIS